MKTIFMRLEVAGLSRMADFMAALVEVIDGLAEEITTGDDGEDLPDVSMKLFYRLGERGEWQRRRLLRKEKKKSKEQLARVLESKETL